MRTLEYALFAGLAAMLRLMPLRAVRFCARCTADLSFACIPVRKKQTLEQIRSAFPDANEAGVRAIARESFRNLFTAIFELMWTPRMTSERFREQIHLTNPELLEAALQRGQGLVLMSGHFGNWEWLCLGAACTLQRRFTVIVHPPHNSGVAKLIDFWRTRFGNRTVAMGASVREVIRTLRQRGIVAMLADQSGPSNALFVPFFGRPAATYEGPAVFALKSGAPMLMGLSVRRKDGSYDVRITEVRTRDLDGVTPDNIRILTERHVQALENGIRENPGQWLWQHRRWKHAPPEQQLQPPA